MELMGVVQNRKDQQTQNEKRKLDRHKKLRKKGSHKLEHKSDVANVKSSLTAVQPFIEARFGKGSEHCLIIEIYEVVVDERRRGSALQCRNDATCHVAGAADKQDGMLEFAEAFCISDASLRSASHN
jgi:hypothetical protein